MENKELIRAIKTNTMNSLLGSKNVQSKMMKQKYPQSSVLFKDTIYLEMFGLPIKHKESKLRKEIIAHMKDFILEMGKDFLFIDEEHRVVVGGKTFKIDLEFYLEALDQEERRSTENPSIGIILCKYLNQGK